jgi:hypothetical protein
LILFVLVKVNILASIRNSTFTDSQLNHVVVE